MNRKKVAVKLLQQQQEQLLQQRRIQEQRINEQARRILELEQKLLEKRKT